MPDKKEQTFTRYHILRSEDEGLTAAFVGEVLASSSDQALRKFFSEPPREEDGDAWYAATSENAVRWRQVAAKVTTRFSEPETSEPEQTAAEPTLPV